MKPSDLKRMYEQKNKNGKFFTRANMAFAGDTMSNYRVSSKTVLVDTYTRSNIECYELERKKPVKHGLNESAFFNARTFELVHAK